VCAVTSVAVDLPVATERLHLRSRLAAIPATAHSRGVFFNLLRDDLARRRLLDIPDLRRLVGGNQKSYGYYPTRDLVEAYAIAGAIVNPDPIDGMRQLFTDATRYYTSTWFGRVLARYLQPDPRAALAWVERSRDFIADYGRWRLEIRGPEHAVIHMFDEYFWIEGALRGGCEGMLIACGVEGEVNAELDDRFNGRLDVRWQLRN
jgi:uncharacterized protein (TIGR02265 family)